MALLQVSCNFFNSKVIEAIPYQETEDGMWGMLSVDGKVIFSEEFKNAPTLVRDGRFFVRNKDGNWEMYKSEEKPQKLGKDYVHASLFEDGRAVVAEKGKPVSIIDTEGNTIKELNEIDGKTVEWVKELSEGYAVFMTTDSLYGAIDKNGKCVIKPEYCALNDYGDGKFIALPKKYKKDYWNHKPEKVKLSVIDTSEKVLFTFSGDKYENFSNTFTDGKLAVSVKKEGDEQWGLIDDKGNYILKPTSKLKNISDISDDKFIYYNGDGWGLMNTKGETLIRAKYESLSFASDKMLIAGVKDGDNIKYKFVDEDDNQIGSDTYEEALPYNIFDNKHTLVKVDDKTYSIIDRKGNQVKDLPDIHKTGFQADEPFAEDYVESDYVDMDKILEAFNITPNGALGLTFNSTPQEAVAKEVKSGTAASDESHPAGSAYWYDITNLVSISKNVSGVNATLEVKFPENLSKQNYRTQRIVDYDDGYYQYYHDENIPTGYSWNNSLRPYTFSLTINHDGRMRGKLRTMLGKMIAKFQSFGKVVKKNDGAAVIKLNNGRTALIYMSKDRVSAVWGDLGDANSIDISEYNDVSEELGGDDYNAPSSDAAVDSVAVDDDYDVADSTTADYDY